jgi:tRNA pseudouridine38-40 synthase
VRVIKLTVEYEGTAYVGWQVQLNGLSIQGELERALSTMLKQPVRITGAGRTDAGVHAEGQVASFKTERGVPLKAFVAGTSALLPKDISVRHAEERGARFDARRSALGKRYRYTIVNRPSRAPLARRFAWEVFQPLDVEAMRAAAAGLVGTHDFSAFRASDCQAQTVVRELRRLEVERAGERIQIEVEATAFLKHMVRNIVGTLVEVGLGRRTVQSVAQVLAEKKRELAGVTAPAHGLCLVEVFYPPKTAEEGRDGSSGEGSGP